MYKAFYFKKNIIYFIIIICLIVSHTLQVSNWESSTKFLGNLGNFLYFENRIREKVKCEKIKIIGLLKWKNKFYSTLKTHFSSISVTNIKFEEENHNNYYLFYFVSLSPDLPRQKRMLVLEGTRKRCSLKNKLVNQILNMKGYKYHI